MTILEKQPELVDKLIANADYMRKGFNELGFNVLDSRTAIVGVVVGEVEAAFLTWRKLFDRGIFVNAFIPPGVPPNMSMMRTSYMSSHEKVHLDRILDAFEITGKELGLIK